MTKKRIVRLRLDFEGVEADRFLSIREFLGVKNDTEVVRALVNQYWRDHKEELSPSLQHFNINEKGVMVLDPSLNPPRGRIIQVYFTPDGIECELCETKPCRHIAYALTIPKVIEIIEKHGWKI